jgi:MFS family permease
MGKVGPAESPPSLPFERGVATRHFRRLYWAWTISLLGDGVRTLALPLYVALETGSPLDASAITLAEVLPWLLTALPAGAIVDRVRPRQVVIVAHLLRAVLTVGLVVAIATDNDPVLLLCAFAFALTVAETFAYPASQVLMVELAGPDELKEANSKFYTVHTIGLNLAGPLAAGALLALSPALAFAVDGLSFVVAAAFVAGIPNVAPKVTGGKVRLSRLTTEIGEGVRLLARIGGLRALVGVVAVAAIASAAVNALTPLYAVKELEMRAEVVASLFIVSALGTLFASRAVVPVAKKWSEGIVLAASLAIAALGMALLGAFQYVITAWVATALIGIGIGGFNVLAAARRQRLTPPAAMGRVSGAYRMLAWGLMPLGAALAGPLAVVTSLGLVFVIAGTFILTAIAALARALLRTDVQLPTPRVATTDETDPATPSPPQSRLTGRAES